MDALSLSAIIITILFWASAFAGIRAGLEHFDPGHLTLYRFLVASAALGTYALIARLRPPAWPDTLRILGLSLLGITAYHIALNYGQVTVPAGTASLIVAAGPVITAVLATTFTAERLTRLGWLGTLISFAGVTMIVLGSGKNVEFTRGALLILLAALSTSLYFVFQKGAVQRVGATRFTVYSLMLGTLPMLAFLPGFAAELQRAPLGAHAAVIYIGLFPGALAYFTWTYALSRVGPSRTTSFLNISPILAILIGWVWLREVPHAMSLAGGAVALAGVTLVNTLGRSRRTIDHDGQESPRETKRKAS